MSCHPLCTWMASLLCGSFHVPSSGQLLRRPCHTLSKKGFSPVWVWSRVEYVEKLLSQLVHLNDFSAIWVLSCSFKWPVIEKILSYFKQKRLLSHVGLVPWWVCWATLVTICALEWLLSRVGPFMFLQVASHWEALVILWAKKASLPCGSGPVLSIWEALDAICAFEWLLSRVGPFMFLQVASYWEDLVIQPCMGYLLSRWVFKQIDVERHLSHSVHLNGFSPVWVLSCSFKWSVIEKIFSYIDHLKGFSPMWVLSCSFKELDLGKHLSQFVHWYGFSTVLQFYDTFSSQTFPSFLLSLRQPHEKHYVERLQSAPLLSVVL